MQGAENKELHGGSNTRDYQFGEHSFSSSSLPLLLQSLSPYIHLRSSISNVTGALLARGGGTKVYPPFLDPALFPSLLMNITDWFTDKLKMLAADIHSNLLWFLKRTTILKEIVFFYRPFTFFPKITQVGNPMSHVNVLFFVCEEVIDILIFPPPSVALSWFLFSSVNRKRWMKRLQCWLLVCVAKLDTGHSTPFTHVTLLHTLQQSPLFQ